mgnify:CR=1 FL=1
MKIHERTIFLILGGRSCERKFLNATQAAATQREQALDLVKNHKYSPKPKK